VLNRCKGSELIFVSGRVAVIETSFARVHR
jgi:hypothetical protein